MSNRDRTVAVQKAHRYISDNDNGEPGCSCGAEFPGGFDFIDHAEHATDALVAAGLIHVGQGFCSKVPNCRLADGHAGGCERT